eukprot:scaffold61545_cov59-Phaeocystis_antarctica.AAC.2
MARPETCDHMIPACCMGTERFAKCTGVSVLGFEARLNQSPWKWGLYSEEEHVSYTTRRTRLSQCSRASRCAKRYNARDVALFPG